MSKIFDGYFLFKDNTRNGSFAIGGSSKKQAFQDLKKDNPELKAIITGFHIEREKK